MRLGAIALLLAAWQQAALPSGVRRWRDMPVGRYDDRTVRRFLEGASHDFARMSVSTVRLQNGRVLAPDTAEQLLIVKEGRLRVSVNSVESLLGPGSIAVLLAGDASRVTGDSACTFYRFSYRAARVRSDTAAAGRSFVAHWDSVPFQPSATGGRRQNADRPTGQFRRFEMHVTTLNAGLTNHAVHTHAAEEFVVVLRGRVRMVIGDTRQSAEPGDVIFIGTNVPHSLDSTGDEPAEYFAFQWM